MSIHHALALAHPGHRPAPARPPAEGPRGAVRPNLVLAAGALASLMTAVDGTVLNVAIPTIRDDLDANIAQLEWIMSAYSLVFAALLVLFGTLGDAHGQRRFMLGGVAVFVAGSVLAALAGSSLTLIVARVITGLGAAALAPTCIAATVAVFPPERRGTAMGVTIGAASIGLALGSLIGGLLVETVGWRWIFWLSVPLGLLTLAMTVLYVPAGGGRGGDARLDLPGVCLLVVGLVGLVYGLIQATVDGWSSGRVIAALATGALFAVAFVARELRARSPLLDLSDFRTPAFGGGVTVGAILSFGLISVFLFISIYYQGVRGLGPIETGLMYLPTTLAVIVLSPLSGRVVQRLGARTVVPIALAVAAAGLGLFATIDPGTPIALLVGAQLAIGVGVGLSLPPLSTAILDAVSPQRSGMASSVTRTSREIAGTFGVAAIGTLVVAFGGAAYRADLSASSLPADLKRAAAAVNPLDHSGAAAQALPPAQADAIRGVVQAATATGIGRALAVGALLVLASAVLAALTLPGRRPAAAQAPS